MGRVVTVLGWCLGVVATVLWVSAYSANRTLKSEVQELSARHALALARMEVQAEQIALLSGDVSGVTGQLQAAELTMEMLESILHALPDATEVPGEDLASANDTGRLEDASITEETGEEETEKVNPFTAIFSGEMSDEVLLASARMSLETQYGGFLNGLDAETAGQARLVLTQILLDQTQQGMGVIRGELSADEIYEGDFEQRMRDELSYILTAEEVAVFDEYQATLQERMLEQSYGMQLSMYASGLSPENHAMVLDVLVEEMLFLGTETSSSSSAPGMDFAELINVYGRVRARFTGVFDENQQAILDRFLEQQESMYEMMIPMMESMQESIEKNP